MGCLNKPHCLRISSYDGFSSTCNLLRESFIKFSIPQIRFLSPHPAIHYFIFVDPILYTFCAPFCVINPSISLFFSIIPIFVVLLTPSSYHAPFFSLKKAFSCSSRIYIGWRVIHENNFPKKEKYLYRIKRSNFE